MKRNILFLIPDSSTEQKEKDSPDRHDDKLLALLGHKAFERFIKIHGNPREIALGFALGVFVGMSPTYGFQIALGVFFAAILTGWQ